MLFAKVSMQDKVSGGHVEWKDYLPWYLY